MSRGRRSPTDGLMPSSGGGGAAAAAALPSLPTSLGATAPTTTSVPRPSSASSLPLVRKPSGGRRRASKGPIVPPFLVKTFEILSRPELAPYISWNAAGDSVVVHDVWGFQSNVLPKYFKHSKWASFVRQLHIYGFRKCEIGPPDGAVGAGAVSPAALRSRCEFKNNLFVRDGQHQLINIKRRPAASSGSSALASHTVRVVRARTKRKKRSFSLTPEDLKPLVAAYNCQQNILRRTQELEANNTRLAAECAKLNAEVEQQRRALNSGRGQLSQCLKDMCDHLGNSLAAASEHLDELAAASKASARATAAAAAASATSAASTGTTSILDTETASTATDTNAPTATTTSSK